MRFGHRGGNQPVKNLLTGVIELSSAQSRLHRPSTTITCEAPEITHINLNDNTVEGLRNTELGVFSVQYHPEASPGTTRCICSRTL